MGELFLGFKHKRHLLYYLIFVDVAIISGMYLSEDVAINREFVSFLILFISSVSYFIAHSNLDFQQQLKDSEATWRLIFEGTGDHIIAGKSGEILFINKVLRSYNKEKWLVKMY